MSDLRELAGDVAEKMSEIERNREIILKRSREIIRSTKKVIHSVHDGDIDDAEIESLKYSMKELVSISEKDAYSRGMTAVEDAMSEYAEAMILCSVIKDSVIPSYEELGISPQAWMLGLADCLGELRRVLLNDLMNSQTEHARRIFSEMEHISDVIMMFDVPEAIVPIRRKQDIARGVMERSRSDMTTAAVMRGMK